MIRCPECGTEVNEQVSRCHSCHIRLTPAREPEKAKSEDIKTRARRGLPFIYLVGYILLIAFITLPLYAVFRNRQKSEMLKDNLEIIFDGLKNYAEDHGSFPDDVEEIIHSGFLDRYPDNPYHERRMRPRKAGSPFAGDFTYIPVFDDRGKAMAFLLVGYGPKLNKGHDLFTEGNDYSRLMSFEPEPDGKPDGIVVVRQSRWSSIQA